MTTTNDSISLNRRRYRLGLRMFTAATRWLAIWLVLALALAVVGAPAIALIWDETASVWMPTISVLQWFAAVAAGAMLNSMLPSLIARGLTRKEITAALLTFGALTTVGLTILATAGFAVEHVMLGLVAEPLDTWAEALANGARYLLVTPVYFFAGAAVIAVALRIGKEGAFVTTLFLLFPALLISGTLTIEFFGYGIDAETAALATWLASGLAFLAALVATVILTLRSIPIRPKGA